MRLFRWSILALAGVGGGMFLGEMAVGTRWRSATGETASYSQLSANPNSLVTQGEGGVIPCPGCADSYGVAARLRAEHENRMNDAFRELGSVELDVPTVAEPPDDGYRYGGRFPDAAPVAKDDAGRDENSIVPTSGGVPSEDSAKAPSPEY